MLEPTSPPSLIAQRVVLKLSGSTLTPPDLGKLTATLRRTGFPFAVDDRGAGGFEVSIL